MKRTHFSILMLICYALCMSSCVTLLRAPFESEAVGADPDRSLPGSPSGDRLSYPVEIENSLEIVNWDGSQALQFSNEPPTGPLRRGDARIGFTAARSRITSGISYIWSGQADFAPETVLLIDVGNGSSGVITRLRIEDGGELSYTTDFIEYLDLGTIDLGEKHTFWISADLNARKFNLILTKNGRNTTFNGLNTIGRSFTSPTSQSISFLYSPRGHSGSRYILDDVQITRPEREDE